MYCEKYVAYEPKNNLEIKSNGNNQSVSQTQS